MRNKRFARAIGRDVKQESPTGKAAKVSQGVVTITITQNLECKDKTPVPLAVDQGSTTFLMERARQ